VEILEAGIEDEVQVKRLWHSISMKEAKKTFKEQVVKLMKYDQQLSVYSVLIDSDESGSILVPKIEICRRSYHILVDDGFPPEIHYFRPKFIFAISHRHWRAQPLWLIYRCYGTLLGVASHIRPKVGGVSNVFFIRWNQSCTWSHSHSCFSYIATQQCMTMGISECNGNCLMKHPIKNLEMPLKMPY